MHKMHFSLQISLRQGAFHEVESLLRFFSMLVNVKALNETDYFKMLNAVMGLSTFVQEDENAPELPPPTSEQLDGAALFPVYLGGALIR